MCRSQGAEHSTWVRKKKIADKIGTWWYIAEIRWEKSASKFRQCRGFVVGFIYILPISVEIGMWI
jgi:hypothetical protein